MLQWDYSRLWSLPEGNASQVLPRQDWARVQRVQESAGCCGEQESARQDPAQENLCSYRAREAQPVQEGLLGQSPRQRHQEEGGPGQWSESRLQETPSCTQRSSCCLHQGQRASVPGSYSLRVHGLIILLTSSYVCCYILADTPLQSIITDKHE